MADLMFTRDVSDPTPLPPQGTETDISSIIGSFSNSPAYQPGSATPEGGITDDDITRDLAIAKDAIGKAANRSTPSYQSPDTAKYLDAVHRVADVANGTISDIDEQRKKYNTATLQEKQAQAGMAAGQVESTNADQERAQQVANNNYEVAHQFGVTGNADFLADKLGQFHKYSDQLIALDGVKQQLASRVEQDAAKLREEASVGFLDDPIRWLSGIFTIPQLTDTVEAGKTQIAVIDNKEATMQNIVSSISNDITLTIGAAKDAEEMRNRTIPSITAQQAAAKNNITAATATELSAKSDMELAKQNSAFAGAKLAQVINAENVEHSAAAFAQQEAELKFRSDVTAVSKANSDAEAKLKIVEIETKMQDSQQIAGMLKLAETRMGYAPGTLTVSRYRAFPDKLRQFTLGQGMGFTGSTPGDAFMNWKEAAASGLQPGPGFPAQSQKMLEDTKLFIQQLGVQEKTKQDLQGKNKDQQDQYFREKINERYAGMQVNPTSNPSSNPFYEQTPRAVATAVPQLANTKIGKILQPYITGSSAPNTEMVVAALRDGAANPEEAAQMISQYYKLNVKVRNGTIDYAAFGLRPTESYIYPARVAGPLFGNSNIPVDLTNSTEVKNFLLRDARKKALSKGLIEGAQGTP